MSTLPDFTGPGFFAGEAPDGLTTIAGTPTSAQVRVYWRDPADPDAPDVLVAQTTSAPDGAWRITGLNPALRYVVRAQKSQFDDVTVVGAAPSRSDVIAYVDNLEPTEEFDGLTGYVLLDSGLPPFTCQVIEPLPYGLSARVEGRKLLIEGVSTDIGLWESVVRVTASNGVWVDVPVQVQIQVLRDPHWDKVVSLLNFDTDFSDIKGESWIAEPANVAIQNSSKRFGQAALQVSGQSPYIFYSTGVASKNWTTQDFTVEGWINHSSPLGRYKNIFVLGDGWSQFTFVVGMTNENKIYLSVAGKAFIDTKALPAGVWHHLAFVRNAGSSFTLYLDGIVLGSVTHTPALISRPRFHLCSNETYGNTFIGVIDEVRITLGVARYTANFTPPTEPFLSR